MLGELVLRLVSERQFKVLAKGGVIYWEHEVWLRQKRRGMRMLRRRFVVVDNDTRERRNVAVRLLKSDDTSTFRR